jgi:hypothetical protein
LFRAGVGGIACATYLLEGVAKVAVHRAIRCGVGTKVFSCSSFNVVGVYGRHPLRGGFVGALFVVLPLLPELLFG